MNKVFLLPITAFLIVACSSKPQETIKEYDYDDVLSLAIPWDEVLSVESKSYYAYVYSPTCGHCNEIKQEVIRYSLYNYGTLYFVQYTKDIPIIDDPLVVIDKSCVEDLGIVGTPSMFRIVDRVVKENIVGSKEIIKTLTKSTQ